MFALFITGFVSDNLLQAMQYFSQLLLHFLMSQIFWLLSVILQTL